LILALQKEVWFLFSKKAQITVYIIIGITLLAGILVYLYINTDIFKLPGPQTQRMAMVAIEPAAIKAYVQSCIEITARPLLFEVAEKGGTFLPSQYGNLTYDAYESYHNVPGSYMEEGPVTYTYASHWELGHGYVSNLITRQTMEKELNVKIREKLPDCLTLDVFKGQGYQYTAGDMKIDTKIGVDDVNIILDYPLTFTEGERSLSFNEFSNSLDVPLGRTFDLAAKIQNDESTTNFFDTADWMLKHGSDIKIYKHKPYPDIVYELDKKIDRTGEILRYNFAMQGLDTAAMIGEARPKNILAGWCYFPADQNCYANAKRDDCNAKGGTYSDVTPDNCRGATTFQETGCKGGACKDCGDRKNGESWCTYDGITGKGFDLVGSRHFLKSCVDGEVYYEECRDYREEMCVSWADKNSNGEDMIKSTCKPNNWQNCYKQRDAMSCANAGDCFWEGWLEKPDDQGMFITISGSNIQTGPLNTDDITRPYSTRKCIPEVPPGFKHWKGDGSQACSMANMLYDGDYDSDKQVYADNANWYCWNLGDCGNYFNFADQYTADGFFNTDALQQQNKIRSPFDLFPGTTSLADMRSFAIVTSPDKINRSQVALSGNELVNPQSATRALMLSYASFWMFASKEYTKDNFENHIKKHIMTLDFPITAPYGLRQLSMCNIWSAPKPSFITGYSLFPSGGMLMSGTPKYPGTQKCDVCNSDSENKHKPCSEYRCKSLGQGCIFSYKDGRGICRDADPSDKVAPEVVSVTINNSDYTLEDDSLMSTPPPRRFEGKRICHGNCSDDDGTIDGIEPYTILNLKIKFSEPTTCKLSYYPSFDYRGIPLMFVTMFMYPIPVIDNKDLSYVFGTEFKTEMAVDLPVYPPSPIAKQLFANNVKNSALELAFFPSDLEASMLVIVNGFTQLTNQAGDGSDAQNMQKWLADYYAAKPQIMDSFKTAQAAINLILTQSVQGQTILFFDCNDQSGNPNQNFYLKYAVGKDKTPAKLLKENPASGTNLTENSFPLTLYLNEPADCKYDLNKDGSYDVMPYFFDCQLNQIDSLDGTFHCNTNVLVAAGKNDVYVKCKDQPLPVRDYYVRLARSENPAVDSRFVGGSITMNGTIFTINNEEALLSEPIMNVTGDIFFNVFFNRDSVCRYTTDSSKNFLDIPAADGFACVRAGQYAFCSAKLPAPEVNETKSYVIKCVDSEIFSAERNVNPQSFVLSYNR